MKKFTTAQLANYWLLGLLEVVGIVAFFVFVGTGNLFGDRFDFNSGAAFLSTIGFVALWVPAIGAFHITAHHLETQERVGEELSQVEESPARV